MMFFIIFQCFIFCMRRKLRKKKKRIIWFVYSFGVIGGNNCRSLICMIFKKYELLILFVCWFSFTSWLVKKDVTSYGFEKITWETYGMGKILHVKMCKCALLDLFPDKIIDYDISHNKNEKSLQCMMKLFKKYYKK